MEQARRERLKAYIVFVVFAVLIVGFSTQLARLVALTMPSTLPATPLIAGAVLLSLLSIAPLVITFRPEAAGQLLAKLRARQSRSGKPVTMATASRNFSFYAVGMAATPLLYGQMLIFLLGDFTAMLALIPAALILAAVGWVVVGRLLDAMTNMFVQ